MFMPRAWIGWKFAIPAAIAGSAVPLHAQQAPMPFAPPELPVILTRSLYFPFPDGKQIAVTRRYQVRFSRNGAQFQVDGRLLETTVEAPPYLSGLADLERRRSDAGLFPVMLDGQGLIVDSPPASDDGKTAKQAVAEASSIVARAATGPVLRREIMGALHSLTGSTGRSIWPAFLFNPGSAERSISQTVTLADGSTGKVETRILVGRLMPGGLPERVERTVTTHLEGTQRITREVWTFSF